MPVYTDETFAQWRARATWRDWMEEALYFNVLSLFITMSGLMTYVHVGG